MIRLILAILGVVLAGVLFFVYTKPTYDNVQVSQGQIAEYDAALSKATELQSLKQSLLSRYNAFNPNDLDRLQKFLPDHVDNVRLILDLDSLAGRYGLALQNVDVSGSSGQSTTQTQTALGAVSASGQKYDSLTLKFTTHGTYSTFVQFISDLESSLRVVDLVSLSITPDVVGAPTTPLAHTSAAESQYAYNITIRTYWLK